MNPTNNSSLSLYQLVQSSDSSLVSIAVSTKTLRFCVAKLLEVLTEQQLAAKIWVKLPQTKSWHREIQQFQQRGKVDTIYFCSDRVERSTKLLEFNDLPSSSLIPISLIKNPELKRECFLLVVTEVFSGLILAQWQKGKINVEASGKRLQQPHLKMVMSFQPSVVQSVLWGLKSAIADSAIAEEEFTLNSTTTENTVLITNLLFKQIERSEYLEKSLDELSENSHQEDTVSPTLGLQVDFLQNLVEEMRSPITHMKTALSLLESKHIKGEQRQKYLEMLDRECDRQNSVISGLLELLQLHSPMTSEAVFLNELVPGIVSTYQPLASEKQIQLGYRIPDNLPPVGCPTSWLRQIIIQLLNNSLQFTPPEGRVFVQAGTKNDDIELVISDTGRGIDSKDLSKIFNSFYRSKTMTNNNISGAGLGLTIVQQLVQKCGGSISVNSKLDKGSVFKILLPTLPPELIEE